MFDIDKVPIKRKIIACVIIALPVLYYLFANEKFSKITFLHRIIYFVPYGIAFLFAIALCGGIIALAMIIIYGIVLLIGEVLLGIKPEGIIDSLGGIAYISLGISFGLMCYLAFGGHIPKIF